MELKAPDEVLLQIGEITKKMRQEQEQLETGGKSKRTKEGLSAPQVPQELIKALGCIFQALQEGKKKRLRIPGASIQIRTAGKRFEVVIEDPEGKRGRDAYSAPLALVGSNPEKVIRTLGRMLQTFFLLPPEREQAGLV